ncbi:MAG: peptidylprolyl isomerase [Actinomycetota bacterium]
MRSKTRGIALAAVVLLAACGGETLNPSAATVDGRKISIADVSEALDRFEKTAQFDQLAQQSDNQSARRQFEQAYLGQQIRRAVLRPAAEELGIEVGDDEIEGQLEQIRSQFPSEEEFDKALEGQGFTASELDELIRDQVLEEKIRSEVTKGTGPSEEKIRDYYESNEENYSQTRVQHILVEKTDLARSISEQLQRAPEGKVDEIFARLAKKHSTDPSGKDGGQLGWVAPGSLVPEFEQAMDDLGIGDVSEPVQTEFGFHVIRVTGRRTQPFGDVSDEIEAQLGGGAAEDAFREWLTAAYRDADVEVNPRYGELDVATGQIVNPSAEDVPGADESTPEG